MRLQHLHRFAPLLLSVLVAGCGSASAPKPTPVAVTRSYQRWTTTLSWHQESVELKPFKATLHVKPSQGLVPVRATLLMTEMDMPPVPLRWHQIQPGAYELTGIATMAGTWNVTITFRQGQKQWQARFPVNISN